MNIKPSVHVPALSGSRSTLRRALTGVVAGCALVLGVASAQADGSDGTFNVTGKAGFGDGEKEKEGEAKKKGLDVAGSGKFSAKFEGDKLVLRSNKDLLNMGIRKSHTEDAFKLETNPSILIKIDKSKLKLPEGGKSESGNAEGSLTMGGATQNVTIKYTVKDAGATYEIVNASFSFDYTKHSLRNEKICAPIVKTPCMFKTINVTAKGSVKK